MEHVFDARDRAEQVADDVIKLERLVRRLEERVALLEMQRGLTPHEADKPHTCPSCAGSGLLGNKKGLGIGTCYQCKGTGQV